MEDPAEDVFLAAVHFNGQTYRLLEGTAEGNAFYTQLILNVLAGMPDKGHYQRLKQAIASILLLSDAMATRTEMPLHGFGNTSR
jgi:hypothetical protein